MTAISRRDILSENFR